MGSFVVPVINFDHTRCQLRRWNGDDCGGQAVLAEEQIGTDGHLVPCGDGAKRCHNIRDFAT